MPFGQINLSLGVVFVLIFKINLNNIVIMQIHVVIRRVNPALKIDLVQVGRIEDGQFSMLALDILKSAPFSDYIECSSISDSPYIEHHSVLGLIAALISYPNFAIEFFDNTLVLMFDFNLNDDEITKEEEGKGN